MGRRCSVVTGNRASGVAPHGRFAEGGGMFMVGHTRLTVTDSTVSNNVASLVSTNPVTNPDGSVTDSLVNAAGIDLDDGSNVTVVGSHIDGNTASVDNPEGQAAVIDSALQLLFSDLTQSDSTVSGNKAIAPVKDVGDFGPIGGALQWCNLGTLTGLRAIGNSTVVYSVAGDAGSAAAVFAGATSCNGFDPGPSTLSNSLVKDNVATAIASGGRRGVFEAGMIAGSSLTMRSVVVTGNRGFSSGSAGGAVQGGGSWNGMYVDEPCGRYLSFAEREEIALLKAHDHGVRDIARQIGRHPATMSRELRRNAATRAGQRVYRAGVAPWKAQQAGKRSKEAQLVTNPRLRAYVEHKLAILGLATSPASTGAAAPRRDRRGAARIRWSW